MAGDKKPIFNTQVSSEFGDVLDAADFQQAQMGLEADATYTPGFSEMRQKRDLEILEVAQGVRQGNDVSTLPVNVRLVRCSTPRDAKPDGVKLLKAGTKGYRPVTEAEIGKEWFTTLPPGTTKMADGTLRKGDVMYMVTDAKTAARNQLAKQIATQDLVSADDTSTNGLFGVVGQHKGAAPTTKKLSGDKPLSKKEIFAD